jgi:hypothetical protein
VSAASRAAITRRWATARKDRRCRGCSAPIFKGRRYWRVIVPFVPALGFCAPVCEAEEGR